MWKFLVALAVVGVVVLVLARLTAVSLPLVLAGILYLLAETIARRTSAPVVVPTAAARR